MILYCISHKFGYELEKIIRLFLPLEKIKVETEIPESISGDALYTEEYDENDGYRLLSRLTLGDKTLSDEKSFSQSEKAEAEMNLALMAFSQLSSLCGFSPKWGVLTGVRPSKLMMTHILADGEEKAKAYFIKRLLVTEEKAELSKTVAKVEQKITALSKRNSFSLYVSIPFCPSRCSYCSFVSHSIASNTAKKLIPDYVELLKKEIDVAGKAAKEAGLSLKSVYWGGGTPTTLSENDLDRLLTAIENSFDLSGILEYTVEAGRPDTITKEKLLTLKKHNVGRISINPQTFSDSVLEAVGRKHTVNETVEKYMLAREVGFNSINMDLIAGLPTDTTESFKNSVDSAIKLSPENITVHTLALKSSSYIVTENREGVDEERRMISEMTEYAWGALQSAGYMPYYMYRQSKSLGNLENVGWCKKGFECLYNVFMMEECQPIISVGAGAVTKLKEPGGNHIERVFNYKYPFEYVSRFDEIIKRKGRISRFFSEYKL